MQVALTLLAEPRRQAILKLVWDCERTAGEIASHFDITRPAVSQHLRALEEGGLVQVRREGTRRIYAAERAGLEALAPLLFGVSEDPSSRPALTDRGLWNPEVD